MRRALLLLVLLAGCSSEEPAANQVGGDGAAPGRMLPGSDVEVVGGEPPPPAFREAGFSWQGRWAASAALCTDGAWQFAADRIVTAGETSCTVREARQTTAGAELMLTCTAEGNRAEELWTLDGAGETAMRVRRWTEGDEKPFADVTLRRC